MSPKDPELQGELRLHDMEVRLAYQDKVIADLDEVVRSFSLRVQRLERQLADLRDSVSVPEIGPADDKPPHY